MPLAPKLFEAQRLRANSADGRNLRFVLLGAFGALVVALLTTFGPHPASAFAVEQRLARAVRAALDKRAFYGVRASVDGQIVTLNGWAPTPQGVGEAQQIALGAMGAGGFWSGGVVRVVNHVTAVGAAQRTHLLCASGRQTCSTHAASEDPVVIMPARVRGGGAAFATLLFRRWGEGLTQVVAHDMINSGTVCPCAAKASARGGAT